jgi:hypothetical protein
MQGQDDFEFKTIEDILNELEYCSAQNECLTETLNTTLATIQDELKRLSFENDGRKSEIEKLTNENVQQQESIDDILEKMTGLPLGSIIPWVNRPNINSHTTENLPDGWQRCDGSVIPAPSKWEGEKTPNINGEERFLRGGLDGVQLHEEEDSMQAHTHGVSDSGHSHGYDDKYTDYNDGFKGPGSEDWKSDRYDQSHSRTTNTAYSNIKVTDVSGARTSGETRPKNIRVVYIMKVF